MIRAGPWLARATHDTFRSFRWRNFRLWFFGQLISQVGFWAQSTGQALLVLDLTGDGSMLGLVTALQFLPVLIVGGWAGVLADRVDKVRLLVATQTASVVLALALGVLVLTDRATTLGVVILAAITGVAWALDQPARRTIVMELVEERDVANAVSLSGALNNVAKVLGPATAAVLIATVGLGWCFVVNGISSCVVILALLRTRQDEMIEPQTVPREQGQIRAGFRYSWEHRTIRTSMVVLAAVITLSFNWNVLLPLLATRDLDGSSSTYAILTALLSTGAVAGTLWLARHRDVGPHLFPGACALLGASLAALSAAPTTLLAAGAAVGVGAASTVFFTSGLTGVQLDSERAMRGRVMAVFSMVVLGGNAVGSWIAGWWGEHYGARSALAFCAVVALAVAAVTKLTLHPASNAPTPEDIDFSVPV